jgi:hypothetical protein
MAESRRHESSEARRLGRAVERVTEDVEELTRVDGPDAQAAVEAALPGLKDALASAMPELAKVAQTDPDGVAKLEHDAEPIEDFVGGEADGVAEERAAQKRLWPLG